MLLLLSIVIIINTYIAFAVPDIKILCLSTPYMSLSLFVAKANKGDVTFGYVRVTFCRPKVTIKLIFVLILIAHI
jgi:hypothetical protein